MPHVIVKLLTLSSLGGDCLATQEPFVSHETYNGPLGISSQSYIISVKLHDITGHHSISKHPHYFRRAHTTRCGYRSP